MYSYCNCYFALVGHMRVYSHTKPYFTLEDSVFLCQTLFYTCRLQESIFLSKRNSKSYFTLVAQSRVYSCTKTYFMLEDSVFLWHVPSFTLVCHKHLPSFTLVGHMRVYSYTKPYFTLEDSVFLYQTLFSTVGHRRGFSYEKHCFTHCSLLESVFLY